MSWADDVTSQPKQFERAQRHQPTRPGRQGIRPFVFDSSDCEQPTGQAQDDCRAQHQVAAQHPPPMFIKSLPHRRPPAETDGHGSSHRDRCKSSARHRSCKSIEGHPQSARRNQKQNAHDLDSPQTPMPLRKPATKAVAQQNHAEHQRAGSRRDMCIKRPVIAVPEILCATL